MGERRNPILALPLLLMALAVPLWVGYAGARVLWMAHRRVAGYVPVQATVLATSVDPRPGGRGGVSYVPHVRYRYTVRDTTYVSERTTVLDLSLTRGLAAGGFPARSGGLPNHDIQSKRCPMKTLAVLVSLFLTLGGPLLAQQAGTVEKNGQHSAIRLEHLVAGHLSELNGRYKLRVTEVTYDPGGFIGAHHHAGPGIRCVTAGEMTYVQPDRATVYHPGECFFESGDVAHTAQNKTDKPVVLLNFELLPADWSEGSAIPVPK